MQTLETEANHPIKLEEVELHDKQPRQLPHFDSIHETTANNNNNSQEQQKDKEIHLEGDVQAVHQIGPYTSEGMKKAVAAGEEHPQDLQKEIQKHKSDCKVYLHIIILCMGALFIGYELAVLNLSQDKLNMVYDITDNKALYRGILTASLPFGAMFGGGYFSQFFLRNIGERRTMITIDCIAMITCLIFLVENYYAALFARFICGVIMGINEGIIPLYIREISPLQMNGKTGSFFQTFVAIGILIAYLIGLGFPLDEEELEDQGDAHWRFVLTFPIITCGIRAIIFKFFFTHTTPHNYILIGKPDRARVALEDIYKKDFVEEQYQLLEHELAIVQKNKDSFKSMFQPFNYPRLKLGTILMILFQFTGFNAVTYYSKLIFKTASGSESTAITLVIVQGILKCITSTFAGEIAKCFGRRPVLLSGKLFQATMLLALGIVSVIYKDDVEDENVSDFAATLTVALVFLFIIGFSFSTGTVTWFYNSDILTGQMCGFVVGIFQICGLIVALVFPIGEEELGIYTMFFIFSFCTFCGFFYLLPNLKETKGLSKHQIQQMFAGKTLHVFGSSYIEIRKPKQEEEDSVDNKDKQLQPAKQMQ